MSRFEKIIWGTLFSILIGWIILEGYRTYETIQHVRVIREDIRRIQAQICDAQSRFVRTVVSLRDNGMTYKEVLARVATEEFKMLALWVYTNESMNGDELATEHTRKCLKASGLTGTLLESPKRPTLPRGFTLI